MPVSEAWTRIGAALKIPFSRLPRLMLEARVVDIQVLKQNSRKLNKKEGVWAREKFCKLLKVFRKANEYRRLADGGVAARGLQAGGFANVQLH